MSITIKKITKFMKEKCFFEHPNFLKHYFYIKDSEDEEYEVAEDFSTTVS
jgi:hypothetical protein